MRFRRYVATPRILTMMVLAAGALPVQGRSTNGGSIHARHPRTPGACSAVLPYLSVLATPASARADAVTDWNQTAAAALQSPGTAVPPGAGQGAPSTVHLAMVHGAVYDAVNAIAGGHEPYVSSPAALPWYSQEAAVAAAARHVLVNGGLGIPAARMPVIEAAYQATLLPIPAGRRRPAGSPPAKPPRPT